jgi:predicted CopG family antitoxin
MPRRITVTLDDDVYRRLVEESVKRYKRYGNVRALSRVVNELLREMFSSREDLVKLIYSDKITWISTEDFERFRRGLSERFELR